MSTEKLKAASARRSQKKERLTFHLMLLPGMIVLLIFVFVPLLGSVMAFQDYKVGLGFFRSPWVGLENFRIIFTFRDSVQVFWNTLIIAFGKLVLNAIVPVLFSILLNELGGKIFKRAFQTIVYLPHFLSWVVLATVVTNMFSLDGPINAFLGLFGVDGIQFLADNRWFRTVIIGTDVWKEFGYNSVIYLAALLSIDPGLYEAASIDGASRVRQFFSITLPMISPTLFVTLIMRLMASLKVYDLIYMMIDTSNPVLPDVQSLMYLFYREAFVAGNKGYASAIVVWTVLLIGVVTLIQFWGQKKWVNYEV